MKLPIAKEGYPFIVPLGLLAVIFAFTPIAWLSCVFGLLFLFCANFFRDPEREIPMDPKAVVSPADGKVVEIVTEESPHIGEPFTRISIFLNVFNVHVNRMPVEGRIEKSEYTPGKFLAAFNHKASRDNEQQLLLIQSDDGPKILVKQIAGLIARRIVCYAKTGERFMRGERFGMIRFGSRADVFVPLDTELRVTVGDKVSGGSSILGILK